MRHSVRIAVAVFGLFAALKMCAGEAAFLVDNFTTPLPDSASVSCTVETAQPKIGLGSAVVRYRLDEKQRRATLNFQQEGSRTIPGPGMLNIWVKGDGSGTEIEFMLRHAKTRVENDGRRVYFEHGQQNFPRVKLDFSDWREITLDARNLPKDKVIWWDRVEFHGVRPDPKNNPEPKTEGTIGFDDFRMIPAGDKPGAAFQCGLIGDSVRPLSKDIAYFADVRNFTAKPARARARIALTDRNGNKVAERDFPLEVEANAAREFKLELEPENLEGYLPPFVLSGDVLSTDLPEVSATIDEPLTMGNAALLVDDFSNVNGRWFTAGYQQNPIQNQRQWMEWMHGEGQRNSTLFQSSASIARVPLSDANVPNFPPVRNAMQVDFNGEAIVYNGADRYLPGQAYRVGFWVKGDGSGAKLSAVLLDFTNGADFWAGGWKRTYQGELPLCVLDFKEWRFIEVDLPGRGQGSTSPRGSTDGIDFPFELTAFRIQPVDTAKTGSVQFGPVIAKTQVAPVSTLALQIGYDDADFNFGAKHNGWVTLQNGWQFAARKVKAQWTLLDRANEKIAAGQLEAELPPGALKVLPLELAKFGEACEKKSGPFKLEVTVSDSAEPSVSTSRQVMIAKPDSDALLADFETERGYYGWKEGPLWTAQTSSEQAQSGKRALRIGWNKDTNPSVTASIDPAISGAAVEVTLHVFGDESGTIFYPVLGGAPGVNHGGNQTNFFLLRRTDAAAGELQNGVRLNWRGWKSFTFRLPQIPTNWNQEGKVLPFIPTYPTGLHLIVDSRDATIATGAVFVDEIRVKTHLDSAARVSLALERGIESNVNADGTVTLRVANNDRTTQRKVDVSCGIYNWWNVKVAALDAAVELKPGETKRISTQEKLPPGSYSVKAELKENGVALATLEDDLLAAELSKTLGAEWLAAVNDEWKLRAPLQDAFAYIDEDWDWVEHHPGNLQMDTIRERTRRAIERGGDPYVLLGFGAYWTAGIGFEQMKAGAFQRRQRDIGHAVDIFMVPQRMEDWENYVSELMRGAESDVRGWMIWDNPDSAGPMKVDPPQFAQMLSLTDKWRRVYCPKIPLVIGGMSRATAVPYLKQLSEQSTSKSGTTGLDHLTGVQVRLDVGRLSPEDAEVSGYVAELKSVLNSGQDKNKTVLLSDLDWAVEKDAAGLTAFDQAAYLARSAFLLDEAGIKPLLSIRNEDSVRLGLGLVHRRKVTAPPMTEMVQAHDFKPAWWAMVQTRRALSEMKFVANIDVADVVEQRTLAKLYTRGENACAVVLWRNDDAGEVSFAQTGLSVASAQDVLASPVAAKDGWFTVGKMPTIFALNVPAEKALPELRRLWVRDGAESVWPQRVIAAFAPEQGEVFQNSVRTMNSETVAVRGVKFASGGKESFKIKTDGSADLVLRKTFVLDETGQDAEIRVNGKSAGRWNLKRTEAQLSSGPRSACFVIGKELLQGSSEANVELVYATPANTIGWTVLEYKGGAMPLSAWGPVHADQNFGHARFARNVTGSRLKIGTQEFANGIGVFAQSLQEYSLNKQFKRFKALVGVDAITEGKGSVVFEVYADGRKVWSSGTLSGLDKPKEVDVDVSGVERLRLVVTDARDGNKFDAGNWCEAELVR